MKQATIDLLEITDPHHHLWDLKANYYPWLTDLISVRVCGEYSTIRKDYLIEDFLKDASGVNIVRSVHVQAEHDPSDPVKETRWLQKIADRPDSRGFPHGMVAYADLSLPDIDAVLEGHCRHANVRGIRQMLHEAMADPKDPRPSLMEHPVWRKNFKLLKKYDLSFDLQVYYQQMEQAGQLVAEHPDIQFILCHTG
jgi:predicted TIM-barrel fold metal-dependent hydrolase